MRASSSANRIEPRVGLRTADLKMRLENKKGFGAVEVLASISIFAIAALGLALSAAAIIRANYTSYTRTTAINLLQDKMEELKGRTTANVTSCSTGCDNPVPTYRNVAFTRSWTVTTNSPVAGVNQITVTVQWKDTTSHTLSVSSTVAQ
jgi:Tfp pilus assembly protein PilV